MTEQELDDLEAQFKRAYYDVRYEQSMSLIAEVRRLRAAIKAAATDLIEERAGCEECIGEYGRGGSSVGYELEEALK